MFYFSRFSISCYVEVVNISFQQEVTHATATKIGKMSGAVKPIEDLEDLLAHLLPGDCVFVSTDNSWLHGF
jgi:hypothetical protein